MNIKYSFKEVKCVFEESGCKLLSTSDEYKNTRSKMRFVCGTCNENSEMYFSTFINGKPKMCAKCRVKNRKFSRITNTRYSQEVVESIYESHGCIFLGSYTYNDKRYEFICRCGESDDKLFYQFQKTPMCRNCAKRLAYHDRLYDINEVRVYFESKGCKLTSDLYTGVKDDLNYLCINGHKATISFDAFRITDNGRCPKCRIESLSGENNYNWKGGIYTKESHRFRKTYEFKKWRSDVFKRDNYTCKCCGDKGVVNAHHIDGYNWCVEKRTDVDNGITLCEKCHDDFHGTYGYGDNTRNQLEEYMGAKNATA